MPCWPDLWNKIRWLQWLIEPAFILIVSALLIWAPGIRRRWLRALSRAVGASAALFVLGIACFGMLLTSGDPMPQYRTLDSPHGLNEARLMYQEGGVLSGNSSRVDLSQKGHCGHWAAFEYAAPVDVTSTTMLWLDDWHLQIQYHSDHVNSPNCQVHVADVIVTCIPAKERDTDR